jgi:hypothetical protein
MKMKNAKGKTFLFVAGNERTLKRLNKSKKWLERSFFPHFLWQVLIAVPSAPAAIVYAKDFHSTAVTQFQGELFSNI